MNTPLVGRTVARVEDDRLIRGRGQYVADIRLGGTLYARVVRSYLAHGRLVSVDTTTARQRSDVVAVVTAGDIPRIDTLRIPLRVPGGDDRLLAGLQPPLAFDRVRYVGEPIAVVVATDPYSAEDAAEEVWAEIEELPPVLDPVAATEPGAPLLHHGASENVVARVGVENGDVDRLIAGADVVVRDRLAVQRHMAVPLETRGLVAAPDPDGRRVTVWGPTKVKHANRALLAQMLDRPESDIRFVEPDVGGGFGARGEFYPEDFLVPWLALELGQPVTWIEDRAEHFLAMNQSREMVFDLEVAAAGDGRLVAFRARSWCNFGAYVRTLGPTLAVLALGDLPGPYRWDGFAAEMLCVATNKTPTGNYRGPGSTESAFVRERLLDQLAAELELDPAELRRKNLIRNDSFPLTIELGEGNWPLVHDSGDYPAIWQRVLDAAAYDDLRVAQRRRRADGELVGIGISCFTEGVGYGPFEDARVVAEVDGTFTAYVGVASVGQGVRTGLSKILADALGVPLEAVAVSHQDTDQLETGGGAFASRTIVVGGNAILLAVADLAQNAREKAAARLGLTADEVEVAGGLGGGIPLGELEVEGQARFEKPSSTISCGGNVAVVAVDPETGKVDIERFVLGYDIGRAIDPALVHGQLVGAAAQGIGGALLEELVYDENGQPMTTSFVDYLLPTMAEIPDIEAIIIEGGATNPLGAKGAGEGGIVGVLAAIGNAVADALGDPRAVKTLPLTPDAVRALIRERAT